MRLLDTSTFTLHEFFSGSIPRYAILSHRWEGEEVSFQDLESGRARRKEKAFSKIIGCCKQAAADAWHYVWIDSCCIDKTSSSELSEAINSMFQWYENAEVCYVYLFDVQTIGHWMIHYDRVSQFRRSKWWTRAWTLQELLAPKDLVFYDCGWREVGTKKCLEPLVASITGISIEHLYNYRGASIAQKMSWAANRETTRVEDRAYSLLGLFNVSMPPLYGEGTKAFRRLQLEILQTSDDESLFAWTGTINNDSTGLLAESPASFGGSGDIVRRIVDARPPYSMTNKGLRIEVTLMPANAERHKLYNGCFYAPLNCAHESLSGSVALVLVPESPERGNSPFKDDILTFRRVDQLANFKCYGTVGESTVLYVKQIDGIKAKEETFTYLSVQLPSRISTFSLEKNGFHVIQEGFWRESPSKFSPDCKVVNLREFIRNGTDPKAWRDLRACVGDVRYLKFTTRVPLTRDGGFAKPPNEMEEAFVVIMEMRSAGSFETPTVRLALAPEVQSLETFIDQDHTGRLGDPGRGLDRTSKAMKSGRSVSAALRRGFGDGWPVLLLDITIYPEGQLPWPDIPNSYME